MGLRRDRHPQRPRRLGHLGLAGRPSTEREHEPDHATERNGSGWRVSFSDVARAHHKWDSAGGPNSRLRRDFEKTLESFENESESKVVEAYWCRGRASAVALAKMREQDRSGPVRRRLLRLPHRDGDVPDFRLYRETDWVTGDFNSLADLLHQCDVLAIKAIYGLEGFQRALVMQWLLRVEAHVLGYIEWRHPADLLPMAVTDRATRQESRAATPSPSVRQRRLAVEKRRKAASTQLERFCQLVLQELSKIEDYYHQAGQKRARLRYVEGMIVLGLLAVAGAAIASAVLLSVFGLLDLHSAGVRRFYACMIAGAIGAVVSVLIRMSGRRGGFTIDHELGAVGVRRLGSFRPVIGAVSGVVVSLLIQTPLVPIDSKVLSIELYVVVAFLAGFSERWTKVVLTNAMRTIDKTEDDGGDESMGTGSSSPRSTAVR